MSWYPNTHAHLFTSNPSPRAAEGLIVRHTAIIEELQRQTRILEQRPQECHAILSPIRALPLEILGEIFAFRLADSEYHQGTRIKVTLVDLCLVCKIWRAAALATPRLWSKLTIRAGNFSAEDFESADRWLRRSGAVPRTLKILGPAELDDGGSCRHADCEVANIGLAKLLTEGPTLDTLECTFYKCIWTLFDAMQSSKSDRPRPWDSLRSLGLDSWFDWERPFEQEGNIFRNLPPVTSFRLCLPELGKDWDLVLYFPLLRNLHIPPPFLAHLTTVDLRVRCVVGWSIVYTILQHCTNVETASIDFDGWEQIESHYETILPCLVVLQNLRTLRLSRLPFESILHLPLIETPSLVELDLSFDDGEDLLPDFTDFISLRPGLNKSAWLSFILVGLIASNSFSRLRIHHLKTEDAHLARILKYLPGLTHLTLDKVDFDFESFLGLDWYYPDVLPNLETLELLNLFGRYQTHGKCLQQTISSWALTSRLPNDTPWLKKLVISSFSESGDGDVQEIMYPGAWDAGERSADNPIRPPLSREMVERKYPFLDPCLSEAWANSEACFCGLRPYTPFLDSELLSPISSIESDS